MEVSLQGTYWLIKQQLAQVIAAIEANDHGDAVAISHLAEDTCGSLCADPHTRATCALVRGIALVQYGKSYGGRAAQASGRRKIEKAYHALITVDHPAAWENAAVAALALRQYGDALGLLTKAMRWYAENGDRERYVQVLRCRNRVNDSLVDAVPVVYVEGQMLT